jgi:ADP-ribose pyrophosphatase YjhB (NUDIX family)
MDVRQFLLDNGLIAPNGQPTDTGWQVFSELLGCVGTYPDLTGGIIPSPYGIFDKLLSRTVPTSQELLLIREGRLYLVYRDDENWKGWHVPGGFLSPRETLIMAAQRIADTEIPGSKITGTKLIFTLRGTDNPRFDTTTLLVISEFEGEPTGGRWFEEFPVDFLGGPQRLYPEILAPYLRKG